jgi:DNA replication protein DnaC
MNDLAQIKPILLKLKLSGIIDNLENRIEQARKDKLGYSEFLLGVIQDEIEKREFVKCSKMLKKSYLEPTKTIESYDFLFNPSVHKPTIQELLSCNFVPKKENIFFLGPSGVGKSHLAQAIGTEAIRRGNEVYFWNTFTLLKWLNSGKGDGSFDNKFKKITKVPLLILDDFGLNDLNQMQQQDLYSIICERYEKAATIITSNRDFSEWVTIFSNPLMASAAMDRLMHHAIKIVIQGKSYRMENFVEKNKEKSLTNYQK